MSQLHTPLVARCLLLQNILSNALKFGRAGSTVTATIRCTEVPPVLARQASMRRRFRQQSKDNAGAAPIGGNVKPTAFPLALPSSSGFESAASSLSSTRCLPCVGSSHSVSTAPTQLQAAEAANATAAGSGRSAKAAASAKVAPMTAVPLVPPAVDGRGEAAAPPAEQATAPADLSSAHGRRNLHSTISIAGASGFGSLLQSHRSTGTAPAGSKGDAADQLPCSASVMMTPPAASRAGSRGNGTGSSGSESSARASASELIFSISIGE